MKKVLTNLKKNATFFANYKENIHFSAFFWMRKFTLVFVKKMWKMCKLSVKPIHTHTFMDVGKIGKSEIFVIFVSIYNSSPNKHTYFMDVKKNHKIEYILWFSCLFTAAVHTFYGDFAITGARTRGIRGMRNSSMPEGQPTGLGEQKSNSKRKPINWKPILWFRFCRLWKPDLIKKNNKTYKNLPDSDKKGVPHTAGRVTRIRHVRDRRFLFVKRPKKWPKSG